MGSGTCYRVRSFVKNAKFVEFNTRLLTNFDLLVNRPEQEGYLAILMLPIQMGASPSNQSLASTHIFEGDQLLSQSDYYSN